MTEKNMQEPKPIELNDEELDTVGGGVSREIPQSNLCPRCGARLRPTVAVTGSAGTTPRKLCTACDYVEW